MKKLFVRHRVCSIHLFIFTLLTCLGAAATHARPLTVTESPENGDFTLFDNTATASICVEQKTDTAVLQAANGLAEDFLRVVGTKATIKSEILPDSKNQIIIGTLGQSELIGRLCAQGKLDTNGISGQWESYVLQIVTNPLPNVERALVIAGSDRRGTIYGVYQLSQMMGVSPWYWWADVPVARKNTLALRGTLLKQGPPGVKYRGIFINDEDWGLKPWAANTFDPEFGNIGPKTYARVFELLLRLRLNYLWPAMHACSTSFGDVPENAALADKYGIVMGSSHCEPMLYNNVRWNVRTQGRWNYSNNRDVIHGVWEKTAKDRGEYEAIWTIGIRGIHDAGMERPPNDMPGKISLMSEVFRDQRELLNKCVSTNFGAVAQCFVPYKEVLPIYDAGLQVPDDVTLVWVDDNFGYIRRLSNPAERKRSGGAGVYWHLSYYGGPHSYTWINTTAPALMWEELHKAWENDARTMWVINVGDIKPMEIGMDYFSKLAWAPDAYPLAGQRVYLHDFAAQIFGDAFAQPVADLLKDFYRLGTVRKPELMERSWALALEPERAAELESDYTTLLNKEKALAAAMPESARAAYTELVGFPVRVLGKAGLIFMADRKNQQTTDIAANADKIGQLRAELEAEVGNYNTNLVGGKWNYMMPGLVTGRSLTQWNSQVRWPWGEPTNRHALMHSEFSQRNWRAAATADRQTVSGPARWSVIEGLGPSGRAMALEPASLTSAWAENDVNAPALEYDFTSPAGDAMAFVDFVPSFRIYPGMKLRVSVSVDRQPAVIQEVPGSSGAENENGTIRSAGVQDNYTRARIPLPGLSAGRHVFVIRAVDPGAVIDQISLPSAASQ